MQVKKAKGRMPLSNVLMASLVGECRSLAPWPSLSRASCSPTSPNARVRFKTCTPTTFLSFISSATPVNVKQITPACLEARTLLAALAFTDDHGSLVAQHSTLQTVRACVCLLHVYPPDPPSHVFFRFMAYSHNHNDFMLADEAPAPTPGVHDIRAECSATSWGYSEATNKDQSAVCLLYTSPSPRDRTRSRMPSSA